MVIVMNKETIRKIFNDIIENYEKFDISIEIQPETTEMINWNGEGIRFIKYIRTITIEDRKALKEAIKKDIW